MKQFRPYWAVLVAGCLALIAVVMWMSTPTSAPPVPQAVADAPSPTFHVPVEPVAVAMPAPEIPPDQPAPKQPVVISPEALKDMDDIQFMLRDYRTRFGGNPEGTNAEIMQAVMGNNRVNARLGPPEGQTLNGEGELLDRWGSAYFFHQLSKGETEIRSAGPDRAMWTSDDILMK